MTKKTLEKLPDHVLNHIERLRADHKRNHDNTASYNYTLGLHDAGLITDRERQILFIYTTV